jgi:hypothetical protein
MEKLVPALSLVSSRWLRRRRLKTAVVAIVGIALATGGISGAAVRALAVTGSAALHPDGGQFVSVPIVRVLDTRYGTGGVPATPIPANGTVTFPAAGVFGIPSSADSVVLDINAINPSATGFLTVYPDDATDPGVASVGLRTGTGTNQEATVQVGSDGGISLTNHSSGTVDVAASVTGYYTSPSASSAGDTYVGVGWGSPVANTSTGYNVPQAPIPAGGSLTFQVTGYGHIAAGADVAVLQVNALHAAAAGYLTAYAAGGTDPGVSALAYYSDDTYRNEVYVPLSSAGQATLTNHGTAPVDVSVYARGYYLPPSATPAGGEYQACGPTIVFGTATAGTAMAANSSATFQVTGTDTIPTTDLVTAVTEDVIVTNATAMGRLDEGPAGQAKQPVTSFLSGDSAVAGYDNGLVSTLSPGGQETITNVSSGTVDVQVVVTGYFLAPEAPNSPDSASATVSANSATITWQAPANDGGSPVTGYMVSSWPDSATVSVGGTTYSATLTGLSKPSSDTFTVTATNAVGTSDVAAWSPPNVISGTVVAPNAAATPVAGDEVDIIVFDPNSTSTTPSQIGAATTDAHGNWTFAVPPYSSLPADARAAADSNGGYLNMQAVATGTATVASGNQYSVGAIGAVSAWVGDSSSDHAPPSGSTLPQPAMVMHPDQNDVSSLLTDTTNDISTVATSNPDVAYNAPATDAYGYQELTGNGSYNPNLTADGTDLTNAAITSVSACCNTRDGCATEQTNTKPIRTRHAWTVVSEYHGNWDEYSSLTFHSGTVSHFSVGLSVDGGDVSFGGWDAVVNGSGTSKTLGNRGTYESNQVIAYTRYIENHYRKFNQDTEQTCSAWYAWGAAGYDFPPSGGPAINYGASINNDQNADGTRWRTDGQKALQNLLKNHPRWLHFEYWGFTDYIDTNQGITYGNAGSLGFTLPDGTSVELTFEAETDHNSSSEQTIEADGTISKTPHVKRYDFVAKRNTERHYYWGSNMNFEFGASPTAPHTFYTY